MALMQLPNELLEKIVMHVLPEGFESVALTCRRIYALCTPFTEHHNKLRARFRTFNYFRRQGHPDFVIGTGFDLLTCIAVEPIVARYIREADFDKDGIFRPCELVADAQPDGPVGRLLAQSPYLKQAGLDWQQYFAKIKEEEGPFGRWSPHAAAFLLTLLPNVEKLTLPQRLKPLESTDKLIDAIVRKARRPSSLPYDRPSLARCTTFGPTPSFHHSSQFDLDRAKPFLALPCMRSFRGWSCVAIKDDGRTSSLAQHWSYNFGQTLEVVCFPGCYIDHVAIADFLKHTPRLRSLTYSHMSKGDPEGPPQDWDICKFVTAIEREAGGHLMQLSITIAELRGSVLPGRASLRGCKRLQTLEFPLELAVCNITAAVACQLAKAKEPMSGGSTDHQAPKAPHGDCAYESSFTGNFVPASVFQLSLTSSGTDEHAKALDVMFRDFAAEKDAWLPALQEIHVSCPARADEAYKAQCARLRAEMEELGVVCHLKEYESSIRFSWAD
ncbi:hypothetical protein ABVK25_005317 [Lepraria finkii]|uniref:F-box domain-containing protein n=1 Tax=Lepraria finkii TaxID=1340010 RepID=A0ABR4B9M7_9LECA